MTIAFTCKTNKDTVMVNKLIVTLPGGTTLGIDREQTEYSIVNGTLDMEWVRPYLWCINDCNIFGGDGYAYLEDENEVRTLFQTAEKLELELEDDAGEDYICELIDWMV